MSYAGTVERTVEDAVEAAKADMGSHEVGGFAIMQEAIGEYFYLPLAPDTKLASTEETKLDSRWKKDGDSWSKMLEEPAVGDST